MCSGKRVIVPQCIISVMVGESGFLSVQFLSLVHAVQVEEIERHVTFLCNNYNAGEQYMEYASVIVTTQFMYSKLSLNVRCVKCC